MLFVLIVGTLASAGCAALAPPPASSGGGAPPSSIGMGSAANAPAVPDVNDVNDPSLTITKAEIDGIPTIAATELPPEARETMRLIARGGPFPYSKDGAIFQNRERLLPLQPAGYYREYTVRTPSASNRGARRIVSGRANELYYTDDHYASFRRIVE